MTSVKTFWSSLNGSLQTVFEIMEFFPIRNINISQWIIIQNSQCEQGEELCLTAVFVLQTLKQPLRGWCGVCIMSVTQICQCQSGVLTS